MLETRPLAHVPRRTLRIACPWCPNCCRPDTPEGVLEIFHHAEKKHARQMRERDWYRVIRAREAS